MAASPNPWEVLLNEPSGLADEGAVLDWFDTIARRLLGGCHLFAAGVPHRITEIEFYYHSATHLDPFTHGDPLQQTTGRWYLHRHRGALRNGSFKGLDLTFGGAGSFGGILLRGLEQDGGPLLDGPSVCVDHLLRTAGHHTVAQLDRALRDLACWESGPSLHLRWQPDSICLPLLRTARVGLTLNPCSGSDNRFRYLLRPYRYLSEPRRIRKGKVQMVLALHLQGHPPQQIHQWTGSPLSAIDRHLRHFRAGQSRANLDTSPGFDLDLSELARLHGLIEARHGLPGMGWVQNGPIPSQR